MTLFDTITQIFSWKKPTTYRNVDELFSLQNHNGNYLVNISLTGKYIYFEIPKVACSTVKKTLQKCEDPAYINDDPKRIHNKKASPLLSPSEVDRPLEYYIAKERFFTFGFVRNPYSRVLSCYIDKFLEIKPNNLKLFPILGLDPQQPVSFAMFLERVQQQDPEMMDIHWRPQSLLLPDESVQLDYIGHFENFSSDFQNVLERIYENPAPILSFAKHATGADDKIKTYYTPRTMELVQDIYRQDFQRFQYDIYLPREMK